MSSKELAELENALNRLSYFYNELEVFLPKIYFNEDAPYRTFRVNNDEHTDSLVCYLKGMKAVSTLNASLVLLKSGYTQEVGALCRMLDEACNEILFLIKPEGENALSSSQEQFLDSFYQEEFSESKNILEAHNPRHTVSSQKIHASIARTMSISINPSDAQAMSSIVQKTLSGYVHGAYPQIMEMYGGNPPHFHMHGMLGTPRMVEWTAQVVSYTDKLIMLSILISRKLGALGVEKLMQEFRFEFESKFSTRSDLSPKELLEAAKKSQ
ncbi:MULTISPECIES: hypothetical protein [unclassified Polynucleobacter]|uniref:hypothetical protein n=1 Tax=unclassified Polynucleobacter TaxID=2640945 RepID=UPI00257436B8|nr:MULTISPECIES: hypothetical protein [unclassified Polynucleobacter]BEI43615.1 hypothetical protein PHIN10_17640 [Polynucleobacter sp. HIN10]BEI45389.1 hypothetical protein PHIN11_17610 [Polynucleobacter sp. HIN11]